MIGHVNFSVHLPGMFLCTESVQLEILISITIHIPVFYKISIALKSLTLVRVGPVLINPSTS